MERYRENYMKQQMMINTLSLETGLIIEPREYTPKSKIELKNFVEIVNPPIISMLLNFYFGRKIVSPLIIN